MANKAYRYRIYPDKDQRQKLAATFGCARFVYNKCLDEHERRYAAGEKYASKTDMNNYCVRTLKKEFPFLKEVDKFALTKEKDGRYYVSVLYEYHTMTPLTAGKEAVGLDYRSDGLFVTSEGTVCGMPHYYRKSESKLAKAQRGLRKKKKGSGNWKKQIRKIARIHRHIADQRKDFLHKISAGTANRYDIVCV